MHSVHGRIVRSNVVEGFFLKNAYETLTLGVIVAQTIEKEGRLLEVVERGKGEIEVDKLTSGNMCWFQAKHRAFCCFVLVTRARCGFVDKCNCNVADDDRKTTGGGHETKRGQEV